METNGDKKRQKIRKNPGKFSCIICDYYTSDLKDYNKHLSTRKHENAEKRDKMRQMETENPEKSEKIREPINRFECEFCDKFYSVRGSLWRHQKTCPGKQRNGSSSGFDKDLVLSLISQNKEFQNLLREQTIAMREQNNVFLENSIKLAESNMKVTELTTKITDKPIHMNVMNNSNNTIHNQFNLQFFLNEQCKDAVNLIDFVNSLKVQVEDLEKTGQLGYVDGITRIFMNGLRELDIYKRPIHCTDLKRETVYVKDENKWEKDNPEKEKIKKAIKKIAVKNIQQLPTWQEKHPEYSNVDSKVNDQYMIISKNSLGGYSIEEDSKYEEKIIKNVLKGVIIEKKES